MLALIAATVRRLLMLKHLTSVKFYGACAMNVVYHWIDLPMTLVLVARCSVKSNSDIARRQ